MEENQLPECCCQVTTFKETENKNLQILIEQKLEKKVKTILEKEDITYEEYKILSDKLNDLTSEERLKSIITAGFGGVRK